jgi:hypothetical protein
MFGKNKLLSDGVQATGVVFEKVGPRSTEGGGFADTYHVTVRVKFDDGSTTDVKQKLNRTKAGLHLVGAVVPVRYDAADHSKVEVDVPALEARQETVRNESRLRSVARAEAALNEQATAGPSADEIRNRAAGDPPPTLAQIRNARNNPS